MYVAAERATIPAIKAASPGVYTDVTVKAVYPGTIEYVYVYAKQVDPAAAGGYFDTMLPTLKTVSETAVFPAMLTAGVAGTRKATYTFNNADGSLIWSHTFESS